jgi:2-dehydro-3-deoxyglucarate aldolase
MQNSSKLQLIKIRKKLKNKNIVSSAWMQLSNSNLTEIFCLSKFDCVTFDFEHGIFSVKDLPDLIRVVEFNHKLPLVRLPNKNTEIAAQCLDAGASGLIIPNVNNSLEMKKMIQISQLPPNGKRGVGFSRSNNFGKNFKNYIKNKTKPFIVAMIESKQAIENLESILKTNDLDAVLIGPYDLSASHNIVGKFGSSKFKSILKKITSQCKKHKIPCGLHVIEPNYKVLQKYKKEGFQFLPYGIDTDIFNRSISKLFSN